MTQTRDLIKKMADFFKSEEYYEKGEDARLELSPDDVRCMNEIIKTCEDAISRQAVLDYIHRILNQGTGKKKSFEFIQKYVEKLSSVNPQEKTGHWKAKSFHELYCDNCGFDFDIMRNDFIDKMKYCPNCGAKMQEE